MRVRLVVVVDLDEGMGYDSPEAVKEEVEEALRDRGLDNAGSVSVELADEEG